MKKTLTKILIILILFVGFSFIPSNENFTAKATVLQGYVEKIPPAFFGTWRVKSKLLTTDNPIIFKIKSIDIWNLTQENDVIILSNPFSGATGEVKIDAIKNKTIKFTKKGRLDNKILTDTVEITINENSFIGINNLLLETISDIDGKVIKTETAQYAITGERLAGQSI
jgi:hypothetical protein